MGNKTDNGEASCTNRLQDGYIRGPWGRDRRTAGPGATGGSPAPGVWLFESLRRPCLSRRTCLYGFGLKNLSPQRDLNGRPCGHLAPLTDHWPEALRNAPNFPVCHPFSDGSGLKNQTTPPPAVGRAPQRGEPPAHLWAQDSPSVRLS